MSHNNPVIKEMRRASVFLLSAALVWVSPGLPAYAAEARIIRINVVNPASSGLAAPVGSFSFPTGLQGAGNYGSLKLPSGQRLSINLDVKTYAEPSADIRTVEGIPLAGTVPLLPAVSLPAGLDLPAEAQSAAEPAGAAELSPHEPGSRVADTGSIGRAIEELKSEFGVKTPAKLDDGGAAPSPLPAAPAPAAQKSADGPRPAEPAAAPAQKKSGLFAVFAEPERNRSFWRYVQGYASFLVGFEMYMVGLPFLISSMTKNSLRENHDARADNAQALQALVKENRTIARIAHWVAQAVSYATLPFFSRKAEDGPRTWLTRSMLIRAGVLALVPAVFFSSGIVSLPIAMGALALLFAAQSYFQGITVMMEGKGVARIMGDPSVTTAERTRANAILTFVAGAIAIIAPAIAGHISLIHDAFGKSGIGGAVIYGIYAAAAAAAGLIWASVRLFAGRKTEGAPAATGPPAAAEQVPSGIKGILKNLGTSLWQGIKLVWRNRFLRTMVLLSLINSLFSDPLIFNILPEYAENIIHTSPSAGHLLQVPVLGWFIKGLTSTPMGYFSFMVVLSSIGSIVAAALLKPARRLLSKFGFHSEEALLKPLYLLAILEAPLFLLMLSWHSMAGILVLYGLQALVTSFGALISSGLMQKALGTFADKDVNKVLAAESFVGILAAIFSTVVYGFVLTGIALKTALIIAAAAIVVQALVRAAAPWLAFTKEQRRRQPGPPSA